MACGTDLSLESGSGHEHAGYKDASQVNNLAPDLSMPSMITTPGINPAWSQSHPVTLIQVRTLS